MFVQSHQLSVSQTCLHMPSICTDLQLKANILRAELWFLCTMPRFWRSEYLHNYSHVDINCQISHLERVQLPVRSHPSDLNVTWTQQGHGHKNDKWMTSIHCCLGTKTLVISFTSTASRLLPLFYLFLNCLPVSFDLFLITEAETCSNRTPI